MQLLSELDGFEVRGDVAVLGATNRPDILDPALLRPGRFDRIIDFPMPDESGRLEIFKIHTRGMNLDTDIDFGMLVAATGERTGADIKAICTEAGMFAIRCDRTIVVNDDFRKAVRKLDDRLKQRSPTTMYC
jgi:proteasome regulatory subunit